MLRAIAICLLFIPNPASFVNCQTDDYWINFEGSGSYFNPDFWMDETPAGPNDRAKFGIGSGNEYTVTWLLEKSANHSTVVEGNVVFKHSAANLFEASHSVVNDLEINDGSLRIDGLFVNVLNNVRANGRLEIENASELAIAGSFLAGVFPGELAEVFVRGSGTSINVDGRFELADIGAAFGVVEDQAEIQVEGTFGIGGNGLAVLRAGGNGTRIDCNRLSIATTDGFARVDLSTGIQVETGPVGTGVATSRDAFAILNLSDPLTVLRSGDVDVGRESGSRGELNLINGAMIDTVPGIEESVIGQDGGIGKVTIAGIGSSWLHGSSIFLGDSGMGELTVEDGGALEVQELFLLGTGTNGFGKLTVSGSESIVMANEFEIDEDGGGSVNVLEGATMNVDDCNLYAGTIVVCGTDSNFSTQNLDIIGEFEAFFGGSFSAESVCLGVNGDLCLLDSGTVGQVNDYFDLFDQSRLVMEFGADLTIGGTCRVLGSSIVDILDSNFTCLGGVENQASFRICRESVISGNFFNSGLLDKDLGGVATLAGNLENRTPDATIDICQTDDVLVVEGVFLGNPNTVSALSETVGEGTLVINGHFDPGQGIGPSQFDTNLTLGEDSTTIIEIGESSNPFFDVASESVRCNGTLELGGALQIEVSPTVKLNGGERIQIFESFVMNGQFAGLPDGAIVGSSGEFVFTISYEPGLAAGEDRFVVLEVVPSGAGIVQNGVLTIFGSENNDLINVEPVTEGIQVTVNDNVEFFTEQISSVVIHAGEGIDFITVDFPGIVVNAGPGNDQIEVLGSGPAEIHGEEGNDNILGSSGRDQIFGGPGDDEIDGRQGNDFIDGGAPPLLNPGKNILIGGPGSDMILGGIDDDEIFGGNGADTIIAFDGNDSISGGNGGDDISGGLGDDQISGGSGYDTISGGSGSDIINGGDGQDLIEGGQGNDVLNGNRSHDVVKGGGGDDTLTGGEGNDLLDGGSGFDTATDTGEAGETSIENS